MSIAKRVMMILAATTLVFQLAGCGQQRPAGGGTQQKSDTARDTTPGPQDTVPDTAQ